jgi:hypothetical protein
LQEFLPPDVIGETVRVLVQTVKQYTTFFNLHRLVILYGAGTQTVLEGRAIRLEIRVMERYVERVQIALRKFYHPNFWTIGIRSGPYIEEFRSCL